MKKIKNLLFVILSMGLLFVGTTAEAKTVDWNDLVEKLKDGYVVESLENDKNNGEDITYTITSDDKELVISITINGKTKIIELDYSKENGVVGFTNNTAINSDEDALDSIIYLAWVNDIMLAAGDLYGYKQADVLEFLVKEDDKENFKLADDGIEMTFKDYTYTNNQGEQAEVSKLESFKLDLVNGFGGLVEDTSDCADPEDIPTIDSNTDSENKPTTNSNPVPEVPSEEEPAKNPSTGDVQIYYIIGGIVASLAIIALAIKKLNKKEEII